MKYSKDYIAKIIASVEKRNPGEPEFIQAVKEVLESIEPMLAARPDIVHAGLAVCCLFFSH